MNSSTDAIGEPLFGRRQRQQDLCFKSGSPLSHSLRRQLVSFLFVVCVCVCVCVIVCVCVFEARIMKGQPTGLVAALIKQWMRNGNLCKPLIRK